MSDYSRLGLYEHNIKSYEKVKKQYEHDNIAAIVHATGTGKSFNALQLALDNKNKKIIYVVPYGSIIEHEKKLIEQNSNVSLENDFPNLEFRTYQSFINMSRDEISKLDVDLLILDEFHHLGAPVWGQRINCLIDTHKNLQVFGMTAYTVRDRGSSYERDMTDSKTDELFSNKVVSNYDLCDAMIDGVLPKPNYKSGYVFLEETCKYLENKINSLNPNSKNHKELASLLVDLKKRVHEAPNLSDIFKTNIKPNGKYIYFCPLNSEPGVNDIDSIMKETRQWVHEMKLTENDYEFYMTTSEMGEKGKKNREAFYKNVDLEQNDASGKLRIMFAKNQYNEGIHAPGLNGVIMGRSTNSDIVFFEQLGRALSVGHNIKSEFEEYNLYSKEELIEKCKIRELNYDDSMSKEELIEILIAPIIIDLSNNIEFIKELENNLINRVKKYQIRKDGEKKLIHLKSTTFNISMINEDLFRTIKYMYSRLTMTWMDKYELAKAYYNHHHNLNVPTDFKTINGYEYNENGVNLGKWINTQKLAFNGKGTYKITQDQIALLEKIEMNFELRNSVDEWNKKYELAKAYYNYYHDLNVPQKFKTINGYEYNENGVNLGIWIYTQKLAFNGKGAYKITQDQIALLEKIGMNFELRNSVDEWNKKYELAKVYYHYYHDLNVPQKFKTINGYEYNENGVNLGKWINTQKLAFNGKRTYKITQDQIALLEKIGMNFEFRNNADEWNKKYELAKAYYNYHRNLNIPVDFKTINGYEYDENGINLGKWIYTQKLAFYGKEAYKITKDQINLLNKIGMNFELRNNANEWNKKYELAKAYYDHYHNLNVPQNFKTINGYENNENGVNLGAWIYTQKKAFNRKGAYKITKDQINLLNKIGMNFELRNNDDEWNKKYELAKAYYNYHRNLNIPVDFKTINGYEYDENGINLGKWINTQKLAFKGKGTYKITQDQIALLEKIGMNWMTNRIDEKLQSETITEKNILRKNKEILNRIKLFLIKYSSLESPSKENINQQFLDELNHVLKLK